jgi:hypothetical protein
MRAYRIAEVNGRVKPSRIVVAENIFEAVRKFARCHVIHLEGPLFASSREAPVRFACVSEGRHAGRHFIAYQIGQEF